MALPLEYFGQIKLEFLKQKSVALKFSKRKDVKVFQDWSKSHFNQIQGMEPMEIQFERGKNL